MDSPSLVEHIFAERVPGAKPEWIADILARLVWLTADNGAAICASLKSWLSSENEEEAAVALTFDEVFLWETDAEMEERLSGIEARFPGLSPLCTVARSRWSGQRR
jgi:hypothetical protein